MSNERIVAIFHQIELERRELKRHLKITPKQAKENKKWELSIADNWRFGGSNPEWLENDGPEPDWDILD